MKSVKSKLFYFNSNEISTKLQLKLLEKKLQLVPSFLSSVGAIKTLVKVVFEGLKTKGDN